tara:strand:- start:272 stop:460 length:189 start_codon:yes stop_codon:yes gene_type:complete
MNDEALQSAYRVVNDIVKNNRRSKKKSGRSIDAEEELCYIMRELEWRARRRQAHRDFISQKG